MKNFLKTSVALLALALGTSGTLAQTPVKIGVLSDMSGPYSDFSGPGSLEAAKLAIEDFNAASKKLAVELVSADAQNKTDIAGSIARRWFDTESVDMVIDIPTSGIALGLAGLVKDRNKVLIATTAGTRCIGPGTPGPIPTARPRRSSGTAARAGTFSRRTTPSAPPWRRKPATW